MACKQTAQPVRITALGFADEQLLQRYRGLRVIAGRLHVLHPIAVGLELVVPAELRRYELCAEHSALAHHLPQRRPTVSGGADRRDGGADLHELPLLHLLRAVAGRGVDDLVAEHRGELGFVLQLDQESAVDCELAAGQCPGVQIAAVDDDELVWELPVRDGGQSVANLLHVVGDARIGDVVAAL